MQSNTKQDQDALTRLPGSKPKKRRRSGISRLAKGAKAKKHRPNASVEIFCGTRTPKPLEVEIAVLVLCENELVRPEGGQGRVTRVPLPLL